MDAIELEKHLIEWDECTDNILVDKAEKLTRDMSVGIAKYKGKYYLLGTQGGGPVVINWEDENDSKD